MALPQFELKYKMFAKEMKKVDPTITLIARARCPMSWKERISHGA
jgi:hypothetical protein